MTWIPPYLRVRFGKCERVKGHYRSVPYYLLKQHRGPIFK